MLLDRYAPQLFVCPVETKCRLVSDGEFGVESKTNSLQPKAPPQV